MAYHDTACPCGGRKDPDTLLCPTCRGHADPTDQAIVAGGEGSSWDRRRAAAIRLLAGARQGRRGARGQV